MTADPREPAPPLLIGPHPDELRLGDNCPQPGATPPQVEGRRLILRLIVAFFAAVAIATVCFVVAPLADIPPWVPLAAFGVIAVAVLINAKSEGQLPSRPDGDQVEPGGCCEGRPIGCCPGPRPPGFLRDGQRRR